MKLIVDEMPKYAKDCLVIERKYGDPDAFLRCKIDKTKRSVGSRSNELLFLTIKETSN